jgi:alkanesulfonate monooxygenase SsuD/methylene tetrahydromethanopterin reductase-like flavin-dependent oxidoreductase (luciferase family)
MKFGVFDHVDDSGLPLKEHFDNRLKIIEAYDRCGIRGYHADEHHGTHQGKYYSFNNVPMTLRPIQKPYPELWYATRTPESFAWAAKMGANTVTLAFDKQVREMTNTYKKAWVEAGRNLEDLPLVGVSRHIVVAETDREAKSLASRAYKRWVKSFRKLWLNKGYDAPLKELYPDSWDELEEMMNGCAGSPATVRRYALDEVERCGTNYLVSWFAFGDLGVDHVIRSVELFSERVMPAIA